MSRGRAREAFTLAAQLAKIKAGGGKVFADSKEAVLDEMPDAYKDLDEEMANQADLMEPVKRSTPLGTCGTERPRRRKGRRPEEKR